MKGEKKKVADAGEIDAEKVQACFASALRKIDEESKKDVFNHKVIRRALRDISKYSPVEKWVLASIIAMEAFKDSEVRFSGLENLELIAHIVWETLRQSQTQEGLMFIVGRMAEKSVRMYPELASFLDKEMIKILSGKPESGYIS